MAGAPQKPGQDLTSGAVAIAEPTEIEEEIAVKSQAICRDSAEESITIYEAANCGPTEKLKNGLRINHWWKGIVLLAIHALSQWLHWIPTDLDGAVLERRVCGTLAPIGVSRRALARRE